MTILPAGQYTERLLQQAISRQGVTYSLDEKTGEGSLDRTSGEEWQDTVSPLALVLLSAVANEKFGFGAQPSPPPPPEVVDPAVVVELNFRAFGGVLGFHKKLLGEVATVLRLIHGRGSWGSAFPVRAGGGVSLCFSRCPSCAGFPSIAVGGLRGLGGRRKGGRRRRREGFEKVRLCFTFWSSLSFLHFSSPR